MSAEAEPSWKRPALLVGGAFVGTVLGGGGGTDVRSVVALGMPDAVGAGTPTVPFPVPGRGVSWIWPSENCETGATVVVGVGAGVRASQGVV
jgi:hypothetical protein